MAINELWDTDRLYKGPYKGNAPDLLVGYNHGYRISWDGASGVVAGAVFEDNVKAWSGDHIVDPRIVPGIVLGQPPDRHRRPAHRRPRLHRAHAVRGLAAGVHGGQLDLRPGELRGREDEVKEMPHRPLTAAQPVPPGYHRRAGGSAPAADGRGR